MSMFKSGGGGYLKGVTATLVGITFDTKEWEPKKKGGDPYTTLSAKLTFRTDGATADVSTYLPAGFFYPENQTISEDKATLGSDRDGAIIQGDTELAKFINSIEEKDAAVFEGCDGRNFDCVKGLRVTFDRIVDVERTKQFGKRKDKNDPKKEYNRDWLVVSAVLGKVELPKAGKATAAKTTKATTTKTTKPATTPAAPATASNDAADAALLDILADAKGSLDRKVMGSKATRYRLKKNLDEAVGDALRDTLMSDAYVADAVSRGIITLDGATIALA